MTKRASSSYVRRKVLEHYAKDHPFIKNRKVMYCGGGHEGRGCDIVIDVGLSDWEAEHWQPHALDGSDEPPNTYPCCIPCHRAKTAKHDAPIIAKVTRTREKQQGVRRSSKPMPGSKRSGWKHKMNGDWERRDG